MQDFTPEQAKELREREIFDDRNIMDQYKGMSTEDIVNSLETTELVAVASNRIRDFNWGTMIRNANAFGLDKVIFTGKKRYDRRGTVGAHHYTFVDYQPDIMQVIADYKSRGYTIVAAECVDHFPVTSLFEYQWDAQSVVIFGEEGVSLDDSILEVCDNIVAIPMMGTVRSLNVGTASGIMFSHYNSQIVS